VNALPTVSVHDLKTHRYTYYQDKIESKQIEMKQIWKIPAVCGTSGHSSGTSAQSAELPEKLSKLPQIAERIQKKFIYEKISNETL